MHIMQSRRDFLAGASLAATGVVGARASLADEGPAVDRRGIAKVYGIM